MFGSLRRRSRVNNYEDQTKRPLPSLPPDAGPPVPPRNLPRGDDTYANHSQINGIAAPPVNPTVNSRESLYHVATADEDATYDRATNAPRLSENQYAPVIPPAERLARAENPYAVVNYAEAIYADVRPVQAQNLLKSIQGYLNDQDLPNDQRDDLIRLKLPELKRIFKVDNFRGLELEEWKEIVKETCCYENQMAAYATEGPSACNDPPCAEDYENLLALFSDMDDPLEVQDAEYLHRRDRIRENTERRRSSFAMYNTRA